MPSSEFFCRLDQLFFNCHINLDTQKGSNSFLEDIFFFIFVVVIPYAHLFSETPTSSLLPPPLPLPAQTEGRLNNSTTDTEVGEDTKLYHTTHVQSQENGQIFMVPYFRL